MAIECSRVEIIQTEDVEYAMWNLAEDRPEQDHLRWSYGQF